MSSGLNGLGTSRDLRSTLNLSTSIKLCALAPNCSYGVAVKAKSMAAVNSSGVALKGPSRWLGDDGREIPRGDDVRPTLDFVAATRERQDG